MKILFYKWHSFMNEGIERGFAHLNVEWETFFYQLNDWEIDDSFSKQLDYKIEKTKCDCVFSINYVPLISNVCEKRGIPYIAWVYDSPIHIRNLETLKNECNQLYFFDRGQAEEYKRLGIEVSYMPLAVDTELWHKKIQQNYHFVDSLDISFIGQLYETQYGYYMSPLDEYTRGYIEGIINSQGKIYGGYLIPELITDALLQKINLQYKKTVKDDFQIEKRELEFLLACETTHRERYTALSLLGKHFNVNWYTGDQKIIPNVTKEAYVDYLTQMPVVFHKSKINLNMSLKTIRTGIPMRALDIMGCGGFLLSNYQVELAECFTDGQECVLYESLEDLYEKCSFYYSHESVREKIACAGFEKVKTEFTFENRLKQILAL